MIIFVRAGRLETQSTAPWVGMGTLSPESSGVAPTMGLEELMGLKKLEVGVVLFSGDFRLGRGAESFRDFVLTDFLEDNVDLLGRSHEGMASSIKLVQRVVADMITSLTPDMGKYTFIWVLLGNIFYLHIQIDSTQG